MEDKFALKTLAGESAEETHVSLGSTLDSASASDLREVLDDALRAGNNLVLEGSDVSRISTPALQVLFAAAKSCDRQSQSFGLLEPSQALCEGLMDLGMADDLEEWTQ